MTHAAQTFGIEQAHRQMGWWFFIVEGLCYITGAVIYAVSSSVAASDIDLSLISYVVAHPGEDSSRILRHMGLLASDLPSMCRCWGLLASLWPSESFRLQS